MKSPNSILTYVLLAAVAVLFYLHFTSKTKPNIPVAAKPQNGKACTIAYFEMDSLESQYEYYKDVKKDLDKRQIEAQNVLAKKENEIENLIRSYQNKFKDIGANGNVSDADKAAYMDAQKHVGQLQQDLQGIRQEQANKVSNDVRAELGKVKEKIEAFLKEYNKNGTYTFILSNSADLVYYKDSTYDITNDIVKGLNAEYKKKN